MKHHLRGGGLNSLRRGSLFALIVLVYLCPVGNANEEKTTEYRVKRAFVVNFLKFVEWPKAAEDASEDPFVIAIIGESPLEEGSSNIPDVQVNERKVVMTIERRWNPDSETQKQLLAHCGALFITKSEINAVDRILASVGQRPVLTIGETDGFLDKGGIINFEVEDNKVRFSIHLNNAKKAELTIRSKLLRLAKRVEQD